MTVNQADNTLAYIVKKVRRLTASASEAALSTVNIYDYINRFYSNDFPLAVKTDTMRSVYTFFTRPYIDRYPLDVNYNMGVRAPAYVEGIQGSLLKDRQQFYNVWPRFPTKFQQGGDTVTGVITAIAQPTNPTQITSTAHDLTSGAVILIENVVGMTQLNGNFYTITVIDANTFSLNGINNAAFGAYTSGGTWSSISQTFSFTIPGPFLSKEVVIGGVDTSGNAISITDDGNGVLQYMTTNPVVSVPVQNLNPARPGMYNVNTLNPGLINPTDIGTVDYVSGQIDFTLPSGISLAASELFTVWVSQYQTGRPYSLLFWNNEFTIRPVPKLIHKVEVETYLTPVQFLETTDNPILSQWAELIAIGASLKVLEDRQDMDGFSNLTVLYDRQEGLALNRQAIEELFTPSYTLFNSTVPSVGGVNGVGYY